MTMSPTESGTQPEKEGAYFLDFPHLPGDAETSDGTKRLNRYSSTLTNNHDFPGAQVRQLGSSNRYETGSSLWLSLP